MKKHCIHTLISVIFLWGVYSPASAQSDEDARSFLDMLNQIRTAPYSYAVNLGYTADFLMNKGIDIETTFEPYALGTGDLTDMAENDESRLMDDEATAVSEQFPVRRLTGSTGGVVSFFNFMSRDTAFKIVIDYLFRKELGTGEFTYILSKNYAYAGIAVSAGKVGSGNAWFIDISLGSRELVSEIQMLNLINQVRSNPECIWEYTPLNPAEAYHLNPNIPNLLQGEYPPLFFDAALSESASALSAYVIDGTYPDELSGAQTALERAVYYGYSGEFVQEDVLKMKKVYTSTEENAPSVDSFFQLLVQNQLEQESSIGSLPFLNDLGGVGSNLASQPGEIYVSVFSFVVGGNDPNAVSEDSNSVINEQSSSVYGLLYSDIDGDTLYSPGEELRQKNVTVWVHAGDDEQMQEVGQVTTDNAGHFSMKLESNRTYRFVSTMEDVQVIRDVFVASDQFVALFYTPVPDLGINNP